MYSTRRICTLRLADRAGPAVIGAASQGRPAFESRRAAQVPPSPEIPAARETARSRPRSLPNQRLSWLRPRQWPHRPRFHHPKTSSGPRSSPASRSSPRARTPRPCSRPARRTGARSTRRWPRSRPAPRSRRSAWRRTYSLLLGLERLLSQDEPQLADGAVLSAHQVDALSGTLTALTPRRSATATAAGNGAVAEGEVVLAPVGIPGEEELDDEDEPDEPQDWDESGRRRGRGAARRGARGPARRQALLVRARHRRRQDGRRARLRRGLAHRRCPHPDPPPQPGRPVPRRAARPRLQGPDRARPAQGRRTAPTAR